MQVITFHGSTTDSITNFTIATHFGTREQALSAIGAKHFLDDQPTGIPTLYQVLVNVQDHLVQKVDEDWGAPGPRGALKLVKDLMEFDKICNERAEISRRFNKYFRQLNSIENDADSRVQASEFLIKEVNGKISVVLYGNKVEGSGDSYCVIDPSVISIVSVEHPNWLEVINAFKSHQDWPKGLVKAEAFESYLLEQAAQVNNGD